MWLYGILLWLCFFSVDGRSRLKRSEQPVCYGCRAGSNVLSVLINYFGLSSDQITYLSKFVCAAFQNDIKVCEDTIKEQAKIIHHIIKKNPNISPSKMCQLLHRCNIVSDWEVKIPPKYYEVDNKWTFSGNSFEILHISDIHYDDKYLTGSPVKCQKFLCCQEDSLFKINAESTSAGYWGSYGWCDSPGRFVEASLKHINEKHNNVKYIYFTGDIVSHRIWDTNKKHNLKIIRHVYKELREKFPGKTIFPVLGNHETHPVNLFSPINYTDEVLSTQWLYEEIAELWSYWLPNETKETIKRGGFYTVLVEPGFRIIALNSNVAQIFNWWLFLIDNIDPYGQLQWMVDVLTEAERNNEVVHIISHVPSNGREVEKVWSREFRKILDRFRHVIRGIFNGHTHLDEFILYHAKEFPYEPTVLAWNGGSLTTYHEDKFVNPSYRVFDIDAKNFNTIDYTQFTFNLTEANLYEEEPKWYELYSFRKAYGVEKLAPEIIENVLLKMKDDVGMQEMNFRYSVREAPGNYCNNNCLKSIWCGLYSSESKENLENCF
ncbi:sphingomyelin phosphodiesterase-like [Onthophagus taurus]|uniref:sphingomyelin phosphodiesterase-like n=1 Tax=Onthophagus taurus TaxID=166361 RepID=UPI0039BE1F42